MKRILQNYVIHEWPYVIAGLACLLIANITTPWYEANLFTVVLAVAGVILLVKGGEQYGRHVTKRFYNIKDDYDEQIAHNRFENLDRQSDD